MSAVLKEEYLPYYTYKDYKSWEGDWELIDGIAYAMSPSPAISHQELNAMIIFELKTKLKSCPNCKVIPEIDWRISSDTVVCPDTTVVCNLKKSAIHLRQTPQIIFEILSPSTMKKDKGLKRLLYQQNKVLYYILIEPTNKTAQILKLEDDSYHDEGIFRDKSYHFVLDECEFDFDFKEVFEL